MLILGEKPERASEEEIRHGMSFLAAFCLIGLAAFHFEPQWQGWQDQLGRWTAIHFGRTLGFYAEIAISMAGMAAVLSTSYFCHRRLPTRWSVLVGCVLTVWVVTEIIWRSTHM